MALPVGKEQISKSSCNAFVVFCKQSSSVQDTATGASVGFTSLKRLRYRFPELGVVLNKSRGTRAPGFTGVSKVVRLFRANIEIFNSRISFDINHEVCAGLSGIVQVGYDEGSKAVDGVSDT